MGEVEPETCGLAWPSPNSSSDVPLADEEGAALVRVVSLIPLIFNWGTPVFDLRSFSYWNWKKLGW